MIDAFPLMTDSARQGRKGAAGWYGAMPGRGMLLHNI